MSLPDQFERRSTFGDQSTRRPLQTPGDYLPPQYMLDGVYGAISREEERSVQELDLHPYSRPSQELNGIL